MMSLTFGLFTQVSGSGPLGPLVWSSRLLVEYLKKGGKHESGRVSSHESVLIHFKMSQNIQKIY